MFEAFAEVEKEGFEDGEINGSIQEILDSLQERPLEDLEEEFEMSVEAFHNGMDKLNTLYSRLNYIEENGVSKDLMLSLESAWPDYSNELYPITMYTEDPSNINLEIAVEDYKEVLVKVARFIMEHYQKIIAIIIAIVIAIAARMGWVKGKGLYNRLTEEVKAEPLEPVITEARQKLGVSFNEDEELKEVYEHEAKVAEGMVGMGNVNAMMHDLFLANSDLRTSRFSQENINLAYNKAIDIIESFLTNNGLENQIRSAIRDFNEGIGKMNVPDKTYRTPSENDTLQQSLLAAISANKKSIYNIFNVNELKPMINISYTFKGYSEFEKYHIASKNDKLFRDIPSDFNTETVPYWKLPDTSRISGVDASSLLYCQPTDQSISAIKKAIDAKYVKQHMIVLDTLPEDGKGVKEKLAGLEKQKINKDVIANLMITFTESIRGGTGNRAGGGIIYPDSRKAGDDAINAINSVLNYHLNSLVVIKQIVSSISKYYDAVNNFRSNYSVLMRVAHACASAIRKKIDKAGD